MLLDVILPLLFLMLTGYFLVYKNILTDEQINTLGNFVLKISLPSFLFYALSTRNISDIWQPEYLIAYGSGSVSLFILGYIFCKYYLKYKPNECAIFAMGVSMSNTGFIGAGVLTLLLQHKAAIYLSLTLIVETMFLLPLTLLLAELAQSKLDFKAVVLKIIRIIFTNPFILAIIFGLTLMVAKIQLPQSVAYTLNLVGQTATPLALIVIGGRLVQIKMANFHKHELVFVFMKLILMPSIVTLVFLQMPNVNSEMFLAGVVLAALPMAITYSLIGQSYGVNEKTLNPLIISILLGVISLSTIIYFKDFFTI